MAEQCRARKDDAFLLAYSDDELRTACEFLTNWIPFLSRGLCQPCVRTLSDRIRSLDREDGGGGVLPKQQEDVAVSTSENRGLNGCYENCDTYSIGSWKDGADFNDTVDTHSLGSWKDEADGSPEPVSEVSIQGNSTGSWKDGPSRSSGRALMREKFGTPVLAGRRGGVKMSWADMAQEDEPEVGEETVSSLQLDNGSGLSWEGASEDESKPKSKLSREQREYIRFSNVKRKKDFICLERINGKIVNILDGLEIHTGVFSAAEQIRIVDYVETLKEMGKNGQLKDRTYTAPHKGIRGKGRVTIQFGCCYDYATDQNGNPSGILKDDIVDPIPQLLKVMIKRLVKWHVIPPNCIPDSCIVNIYEEGDCMPPHIENHDFLRPFCTVSFLSECNVLFGSNLKVVGPGEFDGPIAISLPVGSVIVFNGKGADVAKHCVPAVPTKRISITFRRMDESKRPVGYVPDPDLQGLQPLSYEVDKYKKPKTVKPRRSMKKQVVRQEESAGKIRRSIERSLELRHSGQTQQWHASRQRVRVDLERSADHSYTRTVKF
ncbi:RNA demethylase ALKBH9B-like isoform X1 [Ipomoea triloba]|uniref:RNA demethylase ALKBH9B-like isoform X1 n=1 Tax=Ipomoea triloba TaxID=35885 RepID=UPI00125DF06B|nr:RNA demethylase ALKBH9B-like isoform X1 [Ipomoea triloba]